MLNGLIKPDRGTITMRGRVGALIALGAGFNPILTGRENIYINGSVLGLTKKEPERRAARRKGAAGRPGGLRG
jgi:lipopolysaccharide transport system ATP-binding protein